MNIFDNSFIIIMDSSFTICLRAKSKIDSHEPVKIICGNIQASVKVHSHHLMLAAQQIHLRQTSENRKCLQLVKCGEIHVAIQEANSIRRRCEELFEVKVEMNLIQIATEIMKDQNSNLLLNLDDILSLDEILQIFKIGYDLLSRKLFGKVNRKLKKYIKESKRSQSDKKILTSILEMQVQEQEEEKTEEKRESSSNLPSEKIQEKEEGEKNYRNQGKGDRNRNRDSRKQNQSWGKRSNEKNARKNWSREKPIDHRIMLGINGDTEDGWRERYRPKKMVEKEERVEMSENILKQEKVKVLSKPTEKKEVPIVQESRRQINLSNALKSVFSFPKDGQSFNFSTMKDFMLFINGAFWIKYIDGTLSISKGQDSFIRKCQLTFNDSNGFMGQGLTLSLDGMSNLEDGGDTAGNPEISTFTLSASQFFHVVTMEVYCIKPS